jgi:hypothetical protein
MTTWTTLVPDADQKIKAAFDEGNGYIPVIRLGHFTLQWREGELDQAIAQTQQIAQEADRLRRLLVRYVEENEPGHAAYAAERARIRTSQTAEAVETAADAPTVVDPVSVESGALVGGPVAPDDGPGQDAPTSTPAPGPHPGPSSLTPGPGPYIHAGAYRHPVHDAREAFRADARTAIAEYRQPARLGGGAA